MFLQVLSKVGVLFTALFIGAFARHKSILTGDSTKSLAKVVIVITLPFLYFHSLATQFTRELFGKIWPLPLFAICLIGAAYAMARFISRFINLDSRGRATFIYLSTFTNCGFLAIPIASTLYGAEGVMRVVFFNVGFNLLYWTLGVWTLKSSNPDLPQVETGIYSLPKNLVNSGTIGLFAGAIAGFTALKIPSFLLDSANIMGSATIPLALLVVGSIMSKGEIRKLRTYKNALVCVVIIRLIAIPLLALFVTNFFDSLPPLSRAIIVLQSAMPSASTTPIFTARFGGDSQLASAGVFATHACSIITIPLFIALLQYAR
ncbi:MAG: AEC family transporter [Candidatus Omnitrophota bacterium]|nr:AEC family transporter [Candidatus Omnitrophota bacterium]